MIEAVLFDVGDTLLHCETSKARAFLEVGTQPSYARLRELGYRLPPYEAYHRRVVRAFRCAYVWSRIRRREARLLRAFRRLHHRLGVRLDEAQMNDLARGCTSPFRRFFSIDPDALAVVGHLHDRGLKLGLVSNTFFPGFAIDEFLNWEGLLRYFPVRIYSSEVRYRKPRRQIFERALEAVGVAAERVLFVGDRLDKDVRGAARAGMRTVLLAKNGAVPKGRCRPDFVVRRLSEIPPLVPS